MRRARYPTARRGSPRGDDLLCARKGNDPSVRKTANHGKRGPDGVETDTARPAPGRRTLTAGLPARPVQQKAASQGEPDVAAAAQHGISGGSHGLPFLDVIQQSFGDHDVSGIAAHTDGAAAEGARGMGADAFATGDHVAFAGTPDLHTAAHEAAHVVQQRGGVQLSGGVGAAGDRYEQHADRVADAVVRGDSAAGLLDEMSGTGAAATGVQRKIRVDTIDDGEEFDSEIDFVQSHWGFSAAEKLVYLAWLKDQGDHHFGNKALLQEAIREAAARQAPLPAVDGLEVGLGADAEVAVDGEADAGPAGTPIRGALNYRNDCFLHAACQMLAQSYLGVLQDDAVETQSFLVNIRGIGAEAAPAMVGGLADQLAASNANAAALALAPHERAHLEHLQGLIVLRRFLARINAGGADPIGGAATAGLRTVLRRAGIVQTAAAQEDAGPVFSLILDRFGRHGTRDIEVRERTELRDWQAPADLDQVAPPAAERRADWGAYVDPGNAGEIAPEAPERTRESTEDALYVPVNTGHDGLLAWLADMYGPGIIEHFNADAHRRTAEWAVIGADRTPVAVTESRVSRKLLALPAVLTVFLRRALPNGQKDRRAFTMPEVMTLTEEPALPDGAPRRKRYRLKTFLFHQGLTANGGHYWAHRNLEGDGWHRADNARVTQDAQSAAPREGELERDINHGYLYTYELEADDEAGADAELAPQGVALDRDQLPEVAAEPPPLVMPADDFDAIGGASGADVGELARRSRRVRGNGKVRSMPVPGLVDTVEKLVPAERRAALYKYVDQEIDELLPRVLHAYSLDLEARVGRGAVNLPLIDVAQAIRLLDQITAWWIFFNPTLMQRPIEDITPHLSQHLERVVGTMERDRGRLDIGAPEEDEGATGLAPSKPDAPTSSPDVTPDPRPDPKPDPKPDVTPELPAVSVKQPDANAAAKGSDDEEEDGFFGGGGFGLDDEEAAQPAAPPDTRSEAERAIPEWLNTSFHDAVRLRLIANHGDAQVAELRTGPLASSGPAARKIMLLLRNLASDGVPADLEPLRLELLGMGNGALVVDVAATLGLLPGLDPEAREALKPPAKAAPTTTGSQPAPTPAVSADDMLAAAQREGWLTRRETDQAIDAVGSRVFVRSLARNREKQKLSKVRALIEQLGRVPTRPEQSPPLTSCSLIVDTNIVDVLVLPGDMLSPAELEFRAQIIALIEEHGVTDLRLANMNVGETHAYGDLIGTTIRLPTTPERELPWYGVPLEPDAAKRTGEYNKLLMELETGAVGETKGNEDRSMVADALFADTAVEPGATDDDPPSHAVPQLATADKGIYNALMRMTQAKDGASPLEPNDYKDAGNREELLAELVKRTGARYFVPTVGGRSVVIHPLVKPRDEVDDAAATASTAQASGDPRDAAIGPHTVADLMGLIEGEGYGAMIVGGAVRDTQVGKVPKDVDLKTNMPLLAVEALVSGLAAWKDIPRHRFPEMHLVKIGMPPDMIDVSCGPDDGKPGAFDAAADAVTRDFRMNALYMDRDGEIIDPIGGLADLPGAKDGLPEGRLRFACDPGPKDAARPMADAADRVEAVVAFLKREPWCLGRALKFLTRGCTLDAEILDGVRDRAEEILATIDTGDRPVKVRSLLIFKTDLESPEELVELMRRFHFSGAAIRMVLPDSVAGQFNAETPAHDRDVVPRNRGVPDAVGALNGAPELKVDTASGRIYQYRIEATAPALTADQKPEPVLIDIDCTNHDVSGHPAPHYHVFRWFGSEGWSKKHSGLSHTGQPGLPALDGDQYLGPQPWRWAADVDDKNLMASLDGLGARLGITVATSGEVIDFGGLVSMHARQLAHIQAQGRLHELMLVLHNLQAGLELDPDDPLVQDMVGSKQGQFRLRFAPQLAHVDGFLTSCGIAPDHPLFADLDRRRRLRLFDLVNQEVAAERRAPAAKWALEEATTVDEFVQRFEFFVASEPTADHDAGWAGAIEAVERAGIVGGAKLGDGAVEDALAHIGQLGFDSASTAAYHLHKHLDELEPSARTDLVAAATAYAAKALEGVTAADKVEVSGDESGDTVLVCWKGELKTVVRVTPDRTAYLVTSFTKSGGLRARASAPRTVKLATVPEPVAAPVDPRRAAAEKLAANYKVGATFPYQNPALPKGQRHVCRVLSMAQARGLGVTDPCLLDDEARIAVIERDGEFFYCTVAIQIVEVSTGSKDPCPEELVIVPANDE